MVKKPFTRHIQSQPAVTLLNKPQSPCLHNMSPYDKIFHGLIYIYINLVCVKYI